MTPLSSRVLLAQLTNQMSWVVHILGHYENAQAATEEMIAEMTDELASR